MDFDFSPEQDELYEAVCEFARDRLSADVIERDESGRFDRSLWRAAADFGLVGLPVQTAFGGQELDLLTTVRAMEGLGYGCRDNGLVFSLNAHTWSVVMPIQTFGTDAQRERYLPGLVDGTLIGAHAITEEGSGSDAFNLATTARRTDEGWILNGSKTFITNAPVADVAVVFASVDRSLGADGISAFIVERGDQGFETGKSFSKMGLRTSPMGEVFLEDCLVADDRMLGGEGAGVAIFNSSMDYERACILAANVGAMEHQLERCVERARTWRRFGRPIGDFQAVSHRIADMKLRLETARLLLYRTAWLKDQGRRVGMEAAMAKLYISECMLESSLDAIHVFGAYGYTSEYGVERDVRDAVGGTIYSGTSDIQRTLVARQLGL